MNYLLKLSSFLVPVAHAQVPDATTWGAQVGSTTALAGGYVTNTVFNGGIINLIIFGLVVGILVGAVMWIFHKIGFRKKV